MFNVSIIKGYYDSNEAFPVPFEQFWQWVGYSTKGNAKKKLEANFTQDVDYQSFIQIDKREIGATKSEQINLSIDCAKSFAMLAQTDKGKEVRNYFLQCEKERDALLKHLQSMSTLDIMEMNIQKLREQESKIKELETKQLVTETRLRQLEKQNAKSGKTYELLSLSEYCAKTGKPLPSAGTIWGTDDWAKAQIVWNANVAYTRYFEARGYEMIKPEPNPSINFYIEKWDDFKFDERVWKSVYQKKV
jgi:phage anti-repressor protein